MKILIVGASLSGLLFAALCERMGIPYDIFERNESSKRGGGILTLNCGIMPALEQLGIYEKLLEISRPIYGSKVIDQPADRKFDIQIKGYKELTGYDTYAFSRPDLYDLLLSLIPPKRIHYNKRVIQISEYIAGIAIRCADKQEHHGTIVVGADGACSHVRQSLYENLASKGLLPPEDNTGFKNPFITLTGTTYPLPPENFKDIEKDFCTFTQTIGKNVPYCWSTFTVPGNRICWTIHKQVSEEEHKSMVFRASNWSPELADEMVNEVRHLNTDYEATTIGDLIDCTPKGSLTKEWLEDKVFSTWHHGRTVLIGNAAHKILPTSGAGAGCEMHDAVILANCLYDIKSLARDQYDTVFKNYQELRRPYIMGQFEASRRQAKLLYGKKWYYVWARRYYLGCAPSESRTKNYLIDAGYQPQIGFLPLVPIRGNIRIAGRQQCRRYEEETGITSQHIQCKSTHSKSSLVI
ncbi:hypothetical protein BGZ49_005097 [Haplosporangium sp. Z 27]|nr:hypothetical protein BGZ49_005097 [Haplosporangium sp. Z 27]